MVPKTIKPWLRNWGEQIIFSCPKSRDIYSVNTKLYANRSIFFFFNFINDARIVDISSYRSTVIQNKTHINSRRPNERRKELVRIDVLEATLPATPRSVGRAAVVSNGRITTRLRVCFTMYFWIIWVFSMRTDCDTIDCVSINAWTVNGWMRPFNSRLETSFLTYSRRDVVKVILTGPYTMATNFKRREY